MAWLFDSDCYTAVPTIFEFSGGLDRTPKRPTGGTQHNKPFTDEQKSRLPTRATAHGRPNGHVVHFVYEQLGHIYVSRQAVELLEELQPEGWEAIPIAITPVDRRGADLFLDENEYFLLNVFIHRNIIDLETSKLQRVVLYEGSPMEKEYYWAVPGSQREASIKSSEIGDTVIWRGDENICHSNIFFADPLKDRWCELGIPPEVFYPCHDI